MTLTFQDIKNAKPEPESYKLADSRGLFLLVLPTGFKSWRYKYRFAGKEKLLILGQFPDLGLAEARTLHGEARRLLAAGKDPGLEQKRARRERIDATDATFRRLGDEWLEDNEPRWSASNAKRVRNRLELDLYPAFGKLPIGQVDRTDILNVLRKIESRGSIETAKRVRTYIHAIFKRAKGEGLVPATMLIEIDELADALKPARRGRRQPALTSIPELLNLQQCVDKSTANTQTKLASRLLALTLVRIGVLRTALWWEFEGIDWEDPNKPCENPVWKIPADRMKLEVDDKLDPSFAHDVPLSDQAIEVLRAVRVLTGRSDYLFPSAKSWREPMTDAALSSLYKRMAGGKFKGRMVPHGWRTAFSTIMNERAAELERDGDRLIIDMVLAHVPEGLSSSEWAYNRARYFKPRRALLEVWADMISNGTKRPHRLFPGFADPAECPPPRLTIKRPNLYVVR